MTNFKFIAALMVFIAGAGGGYLAARLSQTRSSEKISSMANALAGGVFLGAAFLHMLPDAIENFETFLPDDSYPFFALTAAGGFLVVLFLEKARITTWRSRSGCRVGLSSFICFTAARMNCLWSMRACSDFRSYKL